MNTESLNIIIPAAGMGRRMKSYGPKASIKVGSSTVINNQISILKTYFPNAHITLVCGFKASTVMDETPNYILKVENENYQNTNVARSIGIGLRVLSNSSKVVIIYGDLVFNAETIKSISVDRSSIIITNKSMGDDEVGCVVEGDELRNLMYDLPIKWGQISVFVGKELKLLKQLCWNDNNKTKFGFELINEIIQQGGSFQCIKNDNIKIIDIDNSKDIQKAREILL